MGAASFVQTKFYGGVWSPLAQGRMEDPAYKTGLNVCHNGLPMESGPWARRPGTRFVSHTKAGAAGRLIGYDPAQDEAYQFEFTAGFLRFYRGLSHVFQSGSDQIATLLRITSDTQAVVYLNATIPTGWANGDTIVFSLNSVPCSAPSLCGREFVISDLDSTNRAFKIKDALTGNYVSGVDIAWQETTSVDADQIYKVAELATPYTGTAWRYVRGVQDIDNLLLLHPTIKPRKVSETIGLAAPFQIAAQDFEDGPYLDQNETATTLGLSGLSGSVTVTASSVVGINGGLGFQSTDVGRVIRWRSSAPVWSNATTYAAGATVTSAAGVVFQSLLGTNLNHDPDADDGTWWEVTGDSVTWTWLRITARSSTTVVTATILGAAPRVTTATPAWRLGRYSDTTGWPTCGTYHEGRLWLAGAESNQVDASMSNKPFVFSPTSTDGTVADDNGISAKANATQANVIYWMISTDDGLIMGTLAGEWRVKSTSLDDPLGPSTIQMRRVSTYGCANSEPVNAGQVLFIQRQKRKLMAHVRAAENDYLAENLSITADETTVSGLEELGWQQEPFLTAWARRADGTLVGCFYKKAESSYALKSLEPMWAESAVGWHDHTLGSGRTVESISTGPAPDGLSDALFMVTSDGTTRWVEMLRPAWDGEQENWASCFVDAGAEACCARVQKISQGDSFDGVRIYGCWHLNGATVVPVVAGLDLGDRVVSNGYVDIPFGSDPEGQFTETFLTAESDGDYGPLSTTLTNFYVVYQNVPPAVTTYSLVAHVGPDAAITGSYSGTVICDQEDDNLRDNVYQIQLVSGGVTAGIRKLSGATGAESLQRTEAAVFSGLNIVDLDTSTTFTPTLQATPAIFLSDPDPDKQWLIAPISGGNSRVWGQIEVNTGSNELKWAHTLGGRTSAFDPDGTYIGTGEYIISGTNTHVPTIRNSMAPVRCGTQNGDAGRKFKNFFAYAGSSSASKSNNVCVVWVHDGGMELQNWWTLTGTGLDDVDVCTGRYGDQVTGTFIQCMHPRYGGSQTTPWLFHEAWIRSVSDTVAGSGTRRIGTLSPSDVDPAWTKFLGFAGVMFDQKDGNILVFCTTDEAVANQNYLVKISTNKNGVGAATIVWKTAIPFIGYLNKDPQSCATQEIFGSFGILVTSLSTDFLYTFDTIAGTYTTTAVNPGHVVSTNQLWNRLTSSITAFGSYTDNGTPDPALIGDYLTNTNPPPFTNKWHRIYFGAPNPPGVISSGQSIDLTYLIPSTIGYTYTSQGQLLRPDFGPDAGAQNGPSFGKKRRFHWHATSFYRTRKASVGSKFGNLYPVKFTTGGGEAIAAPGLFTGIVADTVQNDYSYAGQLTWQIDRPYPLTITAMGGNLQAQDR